MADQALRRAAKRLGIDKSASVGEVMNALLDRMESASETEQAPKRTGRSTRSSKEDDA